METTKGPIHICYDRTLPLALAEEAKRIAVQENPANEVDPHLNANDPSLKLVVPCDQPLRWALSS